MTRMAHLVTALPDLHELHIGEDDSPLTDLLTKQVFASVTNSNIKVLFMSSSPVLLQEALLSIDKTKPLHTLFLRHRTSQVSAYSHSILRVLLFQMITKVVLGEQ